MIDNKELAALFPAAEYVLKKNGTAFSGWFRFFLIRGNELFTFFIITDIIPLNLIII